MQEVSTRAVLDRYKSLGLEPTIDMFSPQQQRDLYIKKLGMQIRRPRPKDISQVSGLQPGLVPSFNVGNGGSELTSKTGYYSELAFQRKINVDTGSGKKQLRYGN
jgi:accessory colonization factor AcfC